MPAEEIKERWRNGEVTYGITLKLGSPYLAEVAALSGYDIIKIDMEHSLNAPHLLMPMVQAINGTGATCLVKVPRLDPESRLQFITWVLDMGAEGITLPRTETGEAAAYAASCMRHVPEGIRGASAFYTKYLPGGKTRDVICIAIIENVEGAQNAVDIANTPGIDAVTIGTSDLAQSLGLPTAGTHGLRPGPHEDTAKEIMKACKEAGIPYGGGNDSGPEEEKVLIGLGYQVITLGTDIMYFEKSMKAALGPRYKGPQGVI